MTTLPPCYGIIPARYQSSRFPGKPLADILGKPMFYRVYKRAASCPLLKKVWLATDDERIFSAAEHMEVPVVMTDPNHHSGSDRIMEAAQKIGIEDDSVIVNIQGDEPELDREIISKLVEPFSDPKIEVTTPARIIDSHQADNPDRVKVVRSSRGDALYFSRSKIPYIREDSNSKVSYLLHIGLYAYRLSALQAFTSMKPSPLEEIEKLEQLRLLEAGINIHVVLTDYQGFGVDRPEDLEQVIKKMKGV